MNADLLAIGPHPDDLELSCGGWLALAADRGQRVVMLDLTRGELEIDLLNLRPLRILGRMALRQSLLISGGDVSIFFTRAYSGPIMVVAIVLLLLPLAGLAMRRLRGAKANRQPQG